MSLTDFGGVVRRILSDAGVLLTERKYEALARESMRAGKRLLPRILSSVDVGGPRPGRAAAAALGLPEPVLARVLGYGWQQSSGLSALARTPRAARAGVAELGAVFNLGITLFDYLCDHSPDRARALMARVSPESIEAGLGGQRFAVAPGEDLAVDLLVRLIVRFFEGSIALGGHVQDRQAFARLIRTMYHGERFATGARRTRSRPRFEVWREMRCKSALPLQTVGMLALLPLADIGQTQRSTVHTAARLAGEATWIADDLADVREDWEAGAWSRCLWLLARTAGGLPGDADSALRRLVDTGIAAAEARRLAQRLVRLRDLDRASGRVLISSVQVSVHAWMRCLPD